MSRSRLRLGDLLVQEGIITEKQLQSALEEQKKTGDRLGKQLLDMGLVTDRQMFNLLSRQKIRFGDLLVEEGHISEEQLESALAEQKKTGLKLGRQLVQMGHLSENQMVEVLARKVGVQKVDPNEYWVDQETANLLPESQARRYRAMVLEVRDKSCLVAMADPTDLFAYDEISKLLDRPMTVAAAPESALLNLMNVVYRRTEEISNIAEELGEHLGHKDDIDLSTLEVDEQQASAPVVRLLQSIFEDAIQVGASDIHIEPEEHSLRIRTRKDGVLQEQIVKQANIHAATVSLLKILSGLDITERRLPQDGRFQVRVKGRSIDVRLSTLPLQYGEGVVMRLLDQSSGVASLENVGMPGEMLERFRKIIRQPNGLVLVTGPTGSGKSTTLYGALAELNKPDVKIITVEDPVEYRLQRINQVQVREDIGLSFARVLRTSLRQDPDIVMVGEMRDQETAEVGIRAAITGHLVFSTLHTNDAVSTVNRLMDMGVEPYILAAAMRAVVAQRLLRRICPQCVQNYQPTTQEAAWVRGMLGAGPEDPVPLKRGRGCPTCSNTGFSGRIGVFEILELDPLMVDALRRGDQSEFARAAGKSRRYRPMSALALEYALQGVTTLSEVFRVLGAVDETPADEDAHAAHAAIEAAALESVRSGESTSEAPARKPAGDAPRRPQAGDGTASRRPAASGSAPPSGQADAPRKAAAASGSGQQRPRAGSAGQGGQQPPAAASGEAGQTARRPASGSSAQKVASGSDASKPQSGPSAQKPQQAGQSAKQAQAGQSARQAQSGQSATRPPQGGQAARKPQAEPGRPQQQPSGAAAQNSRKPQSGSADQTARSGDPAQSAPRRNTASGGTGQGGAGGEGQKRGSGSDSWTLGFGASGESEALQRRRRSTDAIE